MCFFCVDLHPEQQSKEAESKNSFTHTPIIYQFGKKNLVLTMSQIILVVNSKERKCLTLVSKFWSSKSENQHMEFNAEVLNAK